MKEPEYFISYVRERHNLKKKKRLSEVEKEADIKYQKLKQDTIKERDKILRNAKRIAMQEKRRIIGEEQIKGLMAVESAKQEAFNFIFDKVQKKLEKISKEKKDDYYKLMARKIKKSKELLEVKNIIVKLNKDDFKHNSKIRKKLGFKPKFEKADIKGCLVLNKDKTKCIEINIGSIIKFLKEDYGEKVIGMMG